MLKLGPSSALITPKEFTLIVWIAQNDAETILGSYVIQKKLDVLKHKLNIFWEGALLLRRSNKCVACLGPREWEEGGMQQNISKLTFVVQMSFATTFIGLRSSVSWFIFCFVLSFLRISQSFFFFPLPSMNSSLAGFYRTLITVNNVQLALIKPVVPRIVCFTF